MSGTIEGSSPDLDTICIKYYRFGLAGNGFVQISLILEVRS